MFDHKNFDARRLETHMQREQAMKFHQLGLTPKGILPQSLLRWGKTLTAQLKATWATRIVTGKSADTPKTSPLPQPLQ